MKQFSLSQLDSYGFLSERDFGDLIPSTAKIIEQIYEKLFAERFYDVLENPSLYRIAEDKYL